MDAREGESFKKSSLQGQTLQKVVGTILVQNKCSQTFVALTLWSTEDGEMTEAWSGQEE